MSLQFPRNRRSLTVLITLSLFVTGLIPPVTRAQNDGRKPIVISFGQPNIWSLEQAHYLLARMHMTNLELQAKALEDDDLDPNATHGSRIRILRQLFEVGAEFDQGIGFQNKRVVESARFNDDRRRNLITNRDQMRAQSLQLSLDLNELRRERQTISDPESERAKQLEAQIKQKEENRTAIDKEREFHDSEIQALGAAPSETPTSPSIPTTSPLNSRLPSSTIDALKADELNKLLDPGRDPKLNATTKLDNTVQLQYEIIAKQLTLLRDEVGPGERLVFLELPQSLYTTPGRGDEKMAQTWWHVNGYTRTDPLVRLLLELYEVEWKWKRIQLVPAFVRVGAALSNIQCGPFYKQQIREKFTIADQLQPDYKFGEMYHEFKCERQSARERVLRNIFKEASSDFDRIEQGGARDTSKTLEAIAKIIGTEAVLTRHEPEKIAPGKIEKKAGAKTRKQILELRDILLNLLSSAEPAIDGSKDAEFTFDQGIEYVPLDGLATRHAKASPTPSPDGSPAPRPMPNALSDMEARAVRTVDIIPRQSSLNVNDIQATVKATGILAAFKFLFGFAGQVNFQRQREQFEQFVHQELYASGFGKGSRDFGWTFGALPGTKRVAPGVRTTYAALVVPDDADSIVLSARGCYFPRKNYQPLNFEDTGHSDWSDDDRFGRYNCGDQQTYVLPVPGGGNTSSFWVNGVNYEPVRQGDFVTVSVRGNNFSSQMGVLVNGVPLHTTVGLAQPHLLPRKAAAEGASATTHPSECSQNNGICGRYERVDQGQIVFSFKLAQNSTIGIPAITLVAPGKSVDLNSLVNLSVNSTQLGKNPAGDYELLVERNERVPFMFGARPSPVLSITDLQFLQMAPVSPNVKALLIGTGFTSTDTIYVSGTEIQSADKIFKSGSLIELTIPVVGDDTYTVTVVQNGSVQTKTVPNPYAFKVTGKEVIRFEEPTTSSPGLLIVKLTGIGFSPRLQVRELRGARLERLDPVSPTTLFIRLRRPEFPIIIQLFDPATGRPDSLVISGNP